MRGRRLRSPIMYFGGKGNMVSKLLKLIPIHKIYVEVFGGSASLLFAKEPSKVEVYNDIDSLVVNFFRVLRDKEKFEEFYRLVCLTPYSREEFYKARDLCRSDGLSDVEKAYYFFIRARQGFSGYADGKGSWSYSVFSSDRGMASPCSKYLSMIDMLPVIHQRLMRVQIDNDDFKEVIRRYDTEETFFYLDPPYVLETRQSGGYRYEMDVKDHEELVDILLRVKGKVLLSGYEHDVYKKLEENGWIVKQFVTACYSVGRTRGTRLQGKGVAKEKVQRIECVWLNYQMKLF